MTDIRLKIACFIAGSKNREKMKALLSLDKKITELSTVRGMSYDRAKRFMFTVARRVSGLSQALNIDPEESFDFHNRLNKWGKLNEDS